MNNLICVISSKADGTMLDRSQGFHVSEVIANRQRFCAANGTDYETVVYQRISYAGDQTYDKVVEVDESHTTRFVPEMAADGLFTKVAGVGLMLPVADCVATILYDPVKHYLATLHLGRHSTLTNIVSDIIAKFVGEGSDVADLQIYTSPAAQRASYHMDYFDHADDPAWHGFYDKKNDGYYLDLPGFNCQRFIDAGVAPENIHISLVDTATSDMYFSHMTGDTHGRFIMLAMIK